MSNGKGDKPRPRQVSWEKFSQNWEDIFKKKKEPKMLEEQIRDSVPCDVEPEEDKNEEF